MSYEYILFYPLRGVRFSYIQIRGLLKGTCVYTLTAVLEMYIAGINPDSFNEKMTNIYQNHRSFHCLAQSLKA